MRGLNDDRRRELELAHAAKNAHAVEIGHHEIEHEQGDGRGARLGHAEERLFAALADLRDSLTEIEQAAAAAGYPASESTISTPHSARWPASPRPTIS